MSSWSLISWPLPMFQVYLTYNALIFFCNQTRTSYPFIGRSTSLTDCYSGSIQTDVNATSHIISSSDRDPENGWENHMNMLCWFIRKTCSPSHRALQYHSAMYLLVPHHPCILFPRVTLLNLLSSLHIP